MPGVNSPDPPSFPDTNVKAPFAFRWELASACTLGAALLCVGWLDVGTYLAKLHKPALTFALTAQPPGVRTGAQEFYLRQGDTCLRLDSIGGLERNRVTSFRHGLGPVSTLEITCAQTHGELSFRFDNPFDDQDLGVACNGQVLEQFTHLPKGELSRTYLLDLRPGRNAITFTYRRYNHDGTTEDPTDARMYAGTFGGLDLRLQ